MDRRHALKLLAAASIAPSFLRWEPEALVDGIRQHLGHEGHERVPPSGPYQFQTLDAQQRATVAEVCEMIIPATDTPGARALHVDEFIDLILSEWSSAAERASFLAGLAALDASSTQEFGVAFVDATAERRTVLLRRLDDELTAARTASKAWKPGTGPKPPDHTKLFWHQMRSLTVTGYYATEIGYTVERQSVLIPGVWKACTPLEAR